MMKKSYLLLIISTLAFLPGTAKEGMWLPNLLKQLNEKDLKAMGLQLPVEELFKEDGKGLNNAVVQFGGGCTGELVSANGLLFTNHHCGFSQIQSLSSLEHNYLEKGYWASRREDELPCPGLTVTFIRDIRDVTAVFKSVYSSVMDETLREKTIKLLSDSLEKTIAQGSGVKGVVRPFFGGNEFYLFVTETFRDIRFVGAPPSNVGNFGGETDNWMWPRHTGDFSVFRIYAGKNNAPADYAIENQPYRTSRFLTINATGIREGDFTMVYGFPGRTQEYLTSAAVELIQQQTNPDRIRLRDLRMKIWQEEMEKNDTVRLQYSSKFRNLANSYKRWKGELKGLKHADVVKVKSTKEKLFTDWAKKYDPENKSLVEQLNAVIDSSKQVNFANDYYTEGFPGIELISIAAKCKSLNDLCRAPVKEEEKIKQAAEKLRAELPAVYKNYQPEVDRKATKLILDECDARLPLEFQPEFLKNYSSGPEQYIEELFSQSAFSNLDSANELLAGFSSSKFDVLMKDPAWQAADQLQSTRSKTIEPLLNAYNERIAFLQRRYVAALRRMNTAGAPYPDANSTLRLSYGKVQAMTPKDGMRYDYFTTANGIVEKNATGETDYTADSLLIRMIESKDYGNYAVNGKLPVAFIASNHTTGGNSGSPVLDAKGQLIGINFDRIWEGVMSDIYYDGEYSRNIAVDIRYVLFIIDKLGNSEWLLDEMNIQWPDQSRSK